MGKRRKTKKRKRIQKIILAVCLVIIGVFEVFGNIDIDEGENVSSHKVQSKSIVETAPKSIPDYSGEDYIVLNDNQPMFIEADFENIKGEHYSDLDWLGRCGTATAMLHQSMMPTEERESIGQVKPSGWNQAKYEGYVNSSPPYLYNRCHLIAYVLTGKNANEENLITGTRYMNATTMLPFERSVPIMGQAFSYNEENTE